MSARPERCCLPHPIELTQLADVALGFADGATVYLCHVHRDWWQAKAQDDPRFLPVRVELCGEASWPTT